MITNLIVNLLYCVFISEELSFEWSKKDGIIIELFKWLLLLTFNLLFHPPGTGYSNRLLIYIINIWN